MAPDLQILLWGLAASAPLGLNLIAKRRDADAAGLSAMLLATWCVGRVLGMLYTVPESMTLYPVEDAFCGGVAFVAWRSRRAWWKAALCGLFVLQCCLHAAFWAAWGAGSRQALLFYVAANNLLFALELLAASWGVLSHVAVSALGRLPVFARVFHSARAPP